MALIRRGTAPVAVGRAGVPGSVHSVPAAAPTVPAQAGPAPISGGPAPGAAGEETSVAVPTLPPHPWAVLLGLATAAVGGAGAMGIGQTLNQPAFEVGNPTAVFGALFAFAAAVERLLEPITRWMPGRREQAWYERTVADMDNGVRGAMPAAAAAKAAVDRARASRGILMWGVATGLSTILASSGGFYVLRALAEDPSWGAVPRWVDALVTGLVVGSGTKPLHDLISRAQKQKENATAA